MELSLCLISYELSVMFLILYKSLLLSCSSLSYISRLVLFVLNEFRSLPFAAVKICAFIQMFSQRPTALYYIQLLENEFAVINMVHVKVKASRCSNYAKLLPLEADQELLSPDKIPNAKEWKIIRMFYCKVCIIHLSFCSQTPLTIKTNLSTISI